jgi:hypothetical protein
MSTHLKLVADNPRLIARPRLDGRGLHDLANRLTEQVKAGHPNYAQVLASLQNLSPFAIATVATWMARAGLSETEILQVVI